MSTSSPRVLARELALRLAALPMRLDQATAPTLDVAAIADLRSDLASAASQAQRLLGLIDDVLRRSADSDALLSTMSSQALVDTYTSRPLPQPAGLKAANSTAQASSSSSASAATVTPQRGASQSVSAIRPFQRAPSPSAASSSPPNARSPMAVLRRQRSRSLGGDSEALKQILDELVAEEAKPLDRVSPRGSNATFDALPESGVSPRSPDQSPTTLSPRPKLAQMLTLSGQVRARSDATERVESNKVVSIRLALEEEEGRANASAHANADAQDAPKPTRHHASVSAVGVSARERSWKDFGAMVGDGRQVLVKVYLNNLSFRMVPLRSSDTKNDLVNAAVAAFRLPSSAAGYTLSLWSDHKKNTEVREKAPYELWLNVVSRSDGRIKFHLHRRRAADSFKLPLTAAPLPKMSLDTWTPPSPEEAAARPVFARAQSAYNSALSPRGSSSTEYTPLAPLSLPLPTLPLSESEYALQVEHGGVDAFPSARLPLLPAVPVGALASSSSSSLSSPNSADPSPRIRPKQRQTADDAPTAPAPLSQSPTSASPGGAGATPSPTNANSSSGGNTRSSWRALDRSAVKPGGHRTNTDIQLGPTRRTASPASPTIGARPLPSAGAGSHRDDEGAEESLPSVAMTSSGSGYLLDEALLDDSFNNLPPGTRPSPFRSLRSPFFSLIPLRAHPHLAVANSPALGLSRASTSAPRLASSLHHSGTSASPLSSSGNANVTASAPLSGALSHSSSVNSASPASWRKSAMLGEVGERLANPSAFSSRDRGFLTRPQQPSPRQTNDGEQ